MNSPDRKLLVLDLDETLIHASEIRLDHEEDFRVSSYYIYRRPHLERFLSFALSTFTVGVWTSSGENYAAQIVKKIFPEESLKFLWSSQRCTMVRNWMTGE